MNCPLCNSQDNINFLRFKDNTYKKCRNCSLVFLSPLKNLKYEVEYMAERGHDLVDSSVAAAKRRTALYYLKKISYLQRQKGSILDIGCSTGIMLRAAKDMGYKIYGVDINREATEKAKFYLKEDNIFCGDFASLDLGCSFSLTWMIDALEHFSSPTAILNKIYSSLAKDGLLFLITPDIKSLSFKILKGRWFHLFPEHICFFSKPSLRYLLEKANFKIVELAGARKYVSLEIIYRHLKIHRHIILANFFLKLIQYLPQRLRNFVFPVRMGEIYAVVRK